MEDLEQVILNLYNLDMPEIEILKLEKNQMLDILRLKIFELTSNGIFSMISKFEDEEKLELIKLYKEQLESYYIANILQGSDLEFRKKVLEIYDEKLLEILKNIKDEYRFEMLNWVDYEFGLEDFEIAEIAHTLKDEEKLKLIKRYINKLSNFNFGNILFSFKNYNEEIESYIKNFIERAGFGNSNYLLAKEIFNKLGARAFRNKENSQLLSDKSIDLFGKEDIYMLFKYFVFNDDLLEVDKILTNSELFKKYQNYRKIFSEEKQIPTMDTRDAILEFNDNTELIKECMISELNTEESRLFYATINEKCVQINCKKELGIFPEKRKKEIKRLIDKNSKEALVYLLTGMSIDEYQDKIKLYISDINIDNVLKNFNQKSVEFTNIKAINEVLKYILDINEIDRKNILNIWNEELAKEFSNEGSTIAKVRNTFKDIEIVMRKIFGKELSISLKQYSLPEPIIDVEDRELKIVKLKGEKFKLIVHALNAFGNGNYLFDKREIGKAYISTSLISDEHLKKVEDRKYYGFRNIGSNALVLEGPSDIGIEADDNSTKVTAEYSEFNTSDGIISKSSGKYNEIALWREYINDNGEKIDIKPDYVVCFDEVTETARVAAREYSPPLIIIEIDTKVYQKLQCKYNSEKNIENFKYLEEYGKTKRRMIDILREATDKSSAIEEMEVLKRLIKNMERELEYTNNITH